VGDTECYVEEFYAEEIDCSFGWSYTCVDGVWETWWEHCDVAVEYPEAGVCGLDDEACWTDAGDAGGSCDAGSPSCTQDAGADAGN
jgi:hypothetical protein